MRTNIVVFSDVISEHQLDITMPNRTVQFFLPKNQFLSGFLQLKDDETSRFDFIFRKRFFDKNGKLFTYLKFNQ